MAVLGDLGAFLAEPPAAYRSAEARERARIALVDLLGVTLAGTTEPVTGVVLAQHAVCGGGEGPARLIGLGQTAGVADAAFINGTVGHALDYDDSNFVLGGHPSVVIYPALLALAEATGRSGAAVLDAYVAGFEVLCRVSSAVNLYHYEKGWHPTATLGVFGAAAAVAHLAGLDARRSTMALAIAAASSSGLKESFGTMAKPIQVGEAARRGVQAAMLAAAGATAPETALDGARGFLALYNGAGNFDLSNMNPDPAEPDLMRSGLRFKRYPCCGATHVVIDAASALQRQAGFNPAAIREVFLEVSARRRPHVDRPEISEPLGAKFSLQFTVAAALIDGTVGMGHFSPESIARSDIRALMQRVRLGDLSGVEGMGQPCRLSVTLEDGETRSISLEAPLGREPEAFAEYLGAKFIDCASTVLPADRAKALFDRLGGFAAEPSVGEILRACDPVVPSRNKKRSQIR